MQKLFLQKMGPTWLSLQKMTWVFCTWLLGDHIVAAKILKSEAVWEMPDGQNKVTPPYEQKRDLLALI